MIYCALCRGRKKIQRPIYTPLELTPCVGASEMSLCTIKTVLEPCPECWGTGRGVNYRIVARRPLTVEWLDAAINRMLQGGKAAEMEIAVGTALDYHDVTGTLIGVTIGKRRVDKNYVTYKALNYFVWDIFPDLPKDWPICIVPVDGIA